MVGGKQAFTNGFSQIMLQANCWTGLLFLAGIAVNSLTMFATAVSCTLTAQLTGMFLHARPDDLARGLYGYNGALIGLAVGFFWPFSASLGFMMILAAALSSCLMKLLLERTPVSALTAPFILLTWLLMLVEPLPQTVTAEPEQGFSGFFLSFGQVMFQENIISGVLFIAALAAVSLTTLLWAAIAVVLSMVTAFMLDLPQQMTLTGIYSYNAILAVLALVGRGGIHPLIIGCSAIMTVLFTLLLQYIGVPPLTAPFVIVTWLILLVMYRYQAMIWLRGR